MPDTRTIALSPFASFSTGDVNRGLHSSRCIVPGQDINWYFFAPLKVRVFFWILRLQKTNTRVMLHRLGCVPSLDCPFCPGHTESITHLFVCCPCLWPLWNIVSPSGRLHNGDDLPALIDGLSGDLPQMHKKARNTAILALLWSIWKSQNRMVFDTVHIPTAGVIGMVVDHLRLWVVGASARIDMGPLLAWCQSIS
jgi:hypothetical protein